MNKQPRQKVFTNWYSAVAILLLIGGASFVGYLLGGIWLAMIMLGFFALILLAGRFDSAIQKKFRELGDHRDALGRWLWRMGLLPRPSEAYMYVISLSLLFLIFFGDLRHDVLYVITLDAKSETIWLVLYMLLGIGYSIFFAFSQRAKTPFEIEVLKYYIVAVLTGVSVATAVYSYHSKVEWYLILTVWNGIHACLLLFFSGRSAISEYIPLPTKQARRIEILLGTGTVFVILFFEKIIWGANWVVALSSVLLTWSLVEQILHSFPFLAEKSPVLGKKTEHTDIAKIEKRERFVRSVFTHIFYAVFFGILGFLLMDHVLGFALGVCLGVIVARGNM